MFFPKSLAGPGYVILNSIRVLNIIALVAIGAASVALLIKTTTDSSFFFFDAVTNVVTLACAVFLILSELNIFKAWFSRNMPLLSQEHGFVTLSLAMFVLGVDILAKLNHDSNTRKRLGFSFWSTVIAAGIVCFVLSIINLAANYLFHDKANGLTARQIRARGAVAANEKSTIASFAKDPAPAEAPANFSLRRSLHLISHPFRSAEPHGPVLPTTKEPASPSSRYSRASYAFKKSGSRFPVRSAKCESYISDIPDVSPLRSEERFPEKSDGEVSPLSMDARFPRLARPDNALHPARSGTVGSYRYR